MNKMRGIFLIFVRDMLYKNSSPTFNSCETHENQTDARSEQMETKEHTKRQTFEIQTNA